MSILNYSQNLDFVIQSILIGQLYKKNKIKSNN